MKEPLLSICIPTYNRASLLESAIKSILSQVTPKLYKKIEICISDNCSTDNTTAVVKRLQKESKIRIRYHKNRMNCGADYNYMKVIEMAKGEYCWYLSSDDEIERGGVKKVLDEINKNKNIDLLIVSRKVYDITMTVPLNRIDRSFDIMKERKEFRSPLEAVRKITTLLGYLSVLIFKRKKWNEAKEGYEEFIGSAYVMVYVLLKMIKSGAKVVFVPNKIIKYRFGNDSFLKGLKLVGRSRIDIEGFYKIGAKVFGENSLEHRAIVNNLFDTIMSRYRIATIKIEGDRKAIRDIFSMYFKYYWKYPRFWIELFPFMLVPKFLYVIASKTLFKRIYYGR
ncbi:MAG: glycosyltransferase family 2 protein [Candidatus Woesearchaeota archaeon]